MFRQIGLQLLLFVTVNAVQFTQGSQTFDITVTGGVAPQFNSLSENLYTFQVAPVRLRLMVI